MSGCDGFDVSSYVVFMKVLFPVLHQEQVWELPGP